MKSMPITLLLTLLAWPLTSAAESVQKGEIRLEMGEQKTMSFKGLKRISIGNPKVADAKTVGDADTFLLFATGSGSTNLYVYRKDKPTWAFKVVVVDDFARETVVLKHADGRALEQLLRPYLTKRGKITYQRQTRALTLVDEKPVVAVMLKMVERFDVKPRQIQFVLRLVEAEQAAKPGPVPDEIKPVAKQIREVLRYNHFKVVDQAFLAIEANQKSKLHVGGQNGYTMELDCQMVAGQKDSIRLKFHLYKSKKTLIVTTVELKDGETAILGASRINGSGKALISVVSMKLK